MKIWIVGLLVLGAALSLVNGESDDDDYEVKRFHVQSRDLGGSPTCFETRRKRSTSQSNGVRDTYGAAPAEDEEEVGASTGPGGTDSASGILLQDSDLLGNAGVLVIRNQAANTPILFELRPVDTDSGDVYYESDGDNSPDDDDDFEDLEDKDTANDENSEEVAEESGNKENRYKPSADLDNNSGEDEEETTVKRRRVPTTRKPKRKPSNADSSLDTSKPSKKRKRISNAPAKRRPNRRKNQSPNKIRKTNKKRKPTKKRKPSKKRNQNKTRRRRPSKKRYEYVYADPISTDSDRRRYQISGNGNSYNRHQYGNRHDSNQNRRKNIGEDVNKGSGEKTVTKTMTTTHTGTAADVNCIIITKEPTPTTQKPFWDILGRSASGSEDRSFGHRKRFKNRVQFANA